MKSQYFQMREAYVEQMKKYFASMYKGLDLSECPIIVAEEEKEEGGSPFDESSSNDDDEDPFSIDGNGDFDPFLDYPGESNDIADPAPSQARITTNLLPHFAIYKPVNVLSSL